MVDFQPPGFPHNFAQNNCRHIKMSFIDASRRQLQSVIKIRVQHTGAVAYSKNTGVFSKIKNRYFCLFFCTNLTVLGVLVGSAGE
jgi:hypothetical protein